MSFCNYNKYFWLFFSLAIQYQFNDSLLANLKFLYFRFSLHLGIQSGPCEEQIIRLDEAYVQNKYKVSTNYDCLNLYAKQVQTKWFASKFFRLFYSKIFQTSQNILCRHELLNI